MKCSPVQYGYLRVEDMKDEFVGQARKMSELGKPPHTTDMFIRQAHLLQAQFRHHSK